MRYFYLLSSVLNIFTFLLYGVDKNRACKNRWRIPEKVLLLLALLGGGLGAFLGMHIFRHKIRKLLFKIGVPCFLILQLTLLGVIWLCL